MSEAFQSGGHEAPQQESEPQKCFVAHSHQAEWHDTIEGVCNELLPEYGLQTWYADCNYDPTTTLRDKIVSMIDSAPYGIYDLSYWRANEHSPWVMPCNVLIELGIAIALNRPTLLLRHKENRIAGIALPKSIQSVTQICEFTGGDYSLEQALRQHLSHQASLPNDGDWQHHRCRFGEIDCSYLQVYPHTAMIGHDKLHCHIADGPDTDQLDFRRTVEKVLECFNNISYSYLDKGSTSRGYSFLLCSHCQLIRSTPFAIYRITPDTSPDTYIAIGISIGLEYRFHYKIPRFIITRDMHCLPSLLQGYEFIQMKNLHSLKTRLQGFVQQILTRLDEPAYWRPQKLPFETRILGSGVTYEDTVEETHTPNSVFISYSRKDKKYLDELHAHLAHYERAGIVAYWDDTEILPGTRWSNEIDDAIESARIAVFLVSADFFASDFIIKHEMTPLLQAAQDRGIMILPVILHSCVFNDTELAQFQAMNDPSEPLDQMSRGKRDVVWRDVAKFVRKALDS